MTNITIDDVAKHAGVSKSTVSQYLNKRYDYMGIKTKEKIKIAIKDLGYQPNIVARSLKSKKTTTIGVIVANILHELSTHVIRAIEDVCHELEFHMIVCNADDEPEKEKKYIEMLRAKQIDGMIIFPTGGNKELYHQMLKENYPIIFMDRYIPDIPITSVLLQNELAVSLAVDEFVKHGHRDIGVVTTSLLENITPRLERIKGYKKILAKHKILLREELMVSVDIDQMQEELKKMMNLPNPPTAILSGNDRSLMEVLKFVKNEEIKVPEQLALIGIDDVAFAEIYNPPLTTIAQPSFKMGRKAATLLLEKIINNNYSNQGENVYRFDPVIIPRSSC